jgi:Kef-type K+ transport system membrane component KefB
MEHVVGLLMPIFFIVTGLSVDLTGLGGSGWLCLLATLGVACTTKWAGAVVPARLGGLSARESVTLGVLMNTRGLTELVILNIGLSLGVLSPKMFSIMALMAVVTTGMAGPLLARAVPALPKWRPAVKAPPEPERQPELLQVAA